jgi:nitrate reductase delta subunit
MLRRTKASPERRAAIDRVRDWTRARFRLDDDVTIMVNEIECGVPGCPPLETVIVFWSAPDRRHHWKVFKPVAAVVEDDLPPWWMKDRLIVQDGACDCC